LSAKKTEGSAGFMERSLAVNRVVGSSPVTA
jgi:hypothetical protein